MVTPFLYGICGNLIHFLSSGKIIDNKALKTKPYTIIQLIVWAGNQTAGLNFKSFKLP